MINMLILENADCLDSDLNKKVCSEGDFCIN